MDDLRGTPLSVGTLEEMIDENHAIVSSAGACVLLLAVWYLQQCAAVLASGRVLAMGGCAGCAVTGAPAQRPPSLHLFQLHKFTAAPCCTAPYCSGT